MIRNQPFFIIQLIIATLRLHQGERIPIQSEFAITIAIYALQLIDGTGKKIYHTVHS